MTAGVEKKVPLFDRIFKPEHIVLENGHSVDRPKSRVFLILLVLLLCVIVAARATGFDFGIIFKRFGQLGVILGQIFRPNFKFFPKVIFIA